MAKKKNGIPNAKTAFDRAAAARARRCDRSGCGEAGDYRAPMHRGEDAPSYWFCLEHVRQYNADWDYFDGWSQAEIERFRREAVTGHRPTWRLGTRARDSGVLAGAFDPLGLFNGDVGGAATGRPLPEPTRRALAELDLDDSASLHEIKMRYKQMVKRFHPDANGGDKRAEERFKKVSEAYTRLLNCGFFGSRNRDTA